MGQFSSFLDNRGDFDEFGHRNSVDIAGNDAKNVGQIAMKQSVVTDVAANSSESGLFEWLFQLSKRQNKAAIS